jgi:N-acetyl-anhydromuramyl-L-alanine amidase AmpD
MKRNLPLRYLFIHHSATPRDTTNPQGLINNCLHWLSSADRNRLKSQGYVADYHFLIDKNGKTWTGQPFAYWSAHSGHDSYNHSGLAICVVADLSKEQMTPVQRKELVRLTTQLVNDYKLKLLRHSDVTNTNCPGNNIHWEQFLKEVAMKSLTFRMQGSQKDYMNINGVEKKMPIHLVGVKGRNLIDFRFVFEEILPLLGLKSEILFDASTKEITVKVV